RKHGARQREWQRKYRVLPLDHLERSAQTAEHRHIQIVRPPNFLACNLALRSAARSGSLQCGASSACHSRFESVAILALQEDPPGLPDAHFRRAVAIELPESAAKQRRP